MADPDSDPSDRVAQLRLQFTDEIEPAESIVKTDDGLVEWLRDEFGDELREISTYNETTYELLYIKPAVRNLYTEQELSAAGDEFILSGRQEDSYHERLYELGNFTYEVQGFEKGQIIRIPLDMRRGLVISFESTVDISVPPFVDQLKDHHDIEFR